MPIFDAKPRSWDTYLAGIGASGALMASASVVFVILVGVVTFNAWPHAGSVLGIGDRPGEVALQTAAKPAPTPVTQQAPSVNLVKLLGGRTPSRQSSVRGGGSLGSVNNPGPDGNGDFPGGSPGTGGGQPQGAQPPASTPSPPLNVVGEAVSGVGNNLQSDTDSIGNSLGGTNSSGLGGLVGGLGRTVNGSLQSLAGNK
jgi:hypothetical protein